MEHQTQFIHKADLLKYYEQWRKEPAETTTGQLRDFISDMCIGLGVPHIALPPPLQAEYARLCEFNPREVAPMEQLLEAIELSIESTDA